MHHSLAYLESSLMLPYQAISLLKKLNKSAAKCFRVSAQFPLNILAVLDFRAPVLKQHVPLVCKLSVGRGLGGLWGACLQTCQRVGGRKTSQSILRSDRWVIAGVSAAPKKRAGYEAGTACAKAGDLQCVTSSVVSLIPLFAYALLSEPLKCFLSANP